MRKVAFSLICVFVIFMLFVFYVLFCVWNKKDSIFMRIKTSKRKKIACLTFCAFYAFYAHKIHLRGGKSLVCILCFLCFLCVWNLLVKKNKTKQKTKRFKVALVPSSTILMRQAIRFAEKLARLSNKTNNIHDTKHEVFL